MAQQFHASSLGAAPRTEEPVPPAGLTFAPEDEHLIVHYLRDYAAGRSIRWDDNVVEAQVYSTEPWSLLGADRETGYFLTKRIRHGSRVKRTAGGGTWAGQTSKREIMSACGEVIGFKALFSFCVGDGGSSSKKPPKKTSGYVMYEYELPSTAVKGACQEGPVQEPVLCCIKKSAREVARSHKRERAEAAQASAAKTSTAAYVHNVNKRRPHPTQTSDAGLEHDSGNSISSRIRPAPERAARECAHSATFTPEISATVGIPSCPFAADRSSALPMYLSGSASLEGESADAANLVSDGPPGMTMAADQQQRIPYHGNHVVMTNADFFEVGEGSYTITIPEYADPVRLADFGTSSSMYAANYSTGPLPVMAWSEREKTAVGINLACHRLFGMTADVNQQPIPYHGEWTARMNADTFDRLGGDTNIGDIVSSTAAEGAGDRQTPSLPCELMGMTTAAATADRQLLLPPDQDKQTVSDEAGSLDQLLSALSDEGFSDRYDSLLNSEPSLPPLVDSGMPFRDCRMPPVPLSGGPASSRAKE